MCAPLPHAHYAGIQLESRRCPLTPDPVSEQTPLLEYRGHRDSLAARSCQSVAGAVSRR